MANPLLAMNFAIINGQKVPVDDGQEFDLKEEPDDVPEFDLQEVKDEPSSKPQEERPVPAGLTLFQKAMTPLVDLMPGTREHMAEFEKVHPVLGAIGRNAVDFTLGESSPLGLGLSALGAGESVASKMGFERAAQLMKIPSRAAGAGMMLHGYSNINDADSLAGKLGGFGEMALGGLAARGARPRAMLERPIPEAMPRRQLALPPAPESVLNQPRFIGGSAGIAENRPYTIDIGTHNPSFGEEATVLPRELEGLSSISPDYAAREGLTFGRPDLIRNPTTRDNLGRYAKFKDWKFNIGDPDAPYQLPSATRSKHEPIVKELTKPIVITPQEREFHYSIADRLKKLITSERGAVGNLKARDELLDALDDSTVTREVQEQGYKSQKSERFNAVDQVKTQGKKGMYERLARMKGEYKKEPFSPLKINHNSARALYNEVQRSSLSTPEKIRTQVALGKLLGDYQGGSLPQRNEIELLRKVFGNAVADRLVQMHAGVPVTLEALNEAANLSKSMMASMDASAPFRQGLPLLHTRQFWQNYGKMFSYANREVYDAMINAMREDPMFNRINSAGVKFTEIGSELGAREEQFMSKIAEKIPGIPASERMYTGFLNKLRFDTAKKLMEKAEQSGLKVFELGSDGTTPYPTKLGKEIASFVNNATGRGSLGRLEKNAVELNSLFFSPRLIASRLTMLNPAYYIKASPFVRKEALKSLFAMATAGKMFEEIGKAAGGTVDTDPKSADFHKVRIGNTRLDPYGGFQQYIVAANRLLSGQLTSTTSGKESELGKGVTPSRAALILGLGGRQRSFMENKFSPLVGFIDDILSGRDYAPGGMQSITDQLGGRKIDAKVANLFAPMIAQDILNLAKEDPSLIPLAVLGAQGIGVQSYGSDDQSGGLGELKELSR